MAMAVQSGPSLSTMLAGQFAITGATLSVGVTVMVSLETGAHVPEVDVVVTLVTDVTPVKFTELVFPPNVVHVDPPLVLIFQLMVPPLWPLSAAV